MKKNQHEAKTIVLRKRIDESEAMVLVNKKKTSQFRSLLSSPKKDEIHVHSLKLYHECILVVSGRYTADYYRKATHSISVDYNVRDVVLGDGLFPVRSKSGFAKVFHGRHGRNKIDLKLEEHVFVKEEGELHFDHHGHAIKFPFKVNSKTIENYPKRILEDAQNVKRPKITHDAAIKKLEALLKKPVESGIRDLSDEFVLQEVAEIYVPIFEARLVGPERKVRIIRIDATRKKVL